MIEILSIAYRTASREEIWSGTGNYLISDQAEVDRIERLKRRHDSLPRRRSAVRRLLGKAFGREN